jgi:hypothetical protein
MRPVTPLISYQYFKAKKNIGVKRIINKATVVTFQFYTHQHVLLQRTLNNKRYKTIFCSRALYDLATCHIEGFKTFFIYNLNQQSEFTFYKLML